MTETVTVEKPLDDVAAGAAALAAIERLSDLREAVEQAQERYDRAKDKAKRAKEELDEAQDAFNVAFDHEVKKVHGEQEDLPLFNQADANAQQVARPEVQALVALLAEVEYKADPLVVAGFTEAERAEATQWAETMKLRNEGTFTAGELPAMPLCLQTDPEPETVTPETLRTFLALLGESIYVPSEEELAAWTPAERLEAMTWARQVYEAKAAAESARTAQPSDEVQDIPAPVDAPPMPACIQRLVIVAEPSEAIADDVVADVQACVEHASDDQVITDAGEAHPRARRKAKTA